MPKIQQLQVPEALLQTYLGGTKTRELYELVYISSLRPDPRDMDEIALVSVTVRTWAKDAREATDQLLLNPQHVMVGRDEHELRILILVSVGPVPGAGGGGVGEESMLVSVADHERELFSRN